MENKLLNNDFILRAPEPEDLDCLMEFENSVEQFVSNGEISGPYSRFQMKNYLSNSTNNLYEDRQLRLMIEDQNKVVVGIVDICLFEPYSNRAEVGIIISPSMRKRGIGESALRLFEQHCFKKLGINMLYAYISIENSSSISLFKKCGYEECACLKEWTKINGEYCDVIMVQKLRQ